MGKVRYLERSNEIVHEMGWDHVTKEHAAVAVEPHMVLSSYASVVGPRLKSTTTGCMAFGRSTNTVPYLNFVPNTNS